MNDPVNQFIGQIYHRFADATIDDSVMDLLRDVLVFCLFAKKYKIPPEEYRQIRQKMATCDFFVFWLSSFCIWFCGKFRYGAANSGSPMVIIDSDEDFAESDDSDASDNLINILELLKTDILNVMTQLWTHAKIKRAMALEFHGFQIIPNGPQGLIFEFSTESLSDIFIIADVCKEFFEISLFCPHGNLLFGNHHISKNTVAVQTHVRIMG